MNATRFLSLTLLLALPACGGGGSGAATTPVTGGGNGQTSQSAYVTPTFTFAFPGSASTSSSSRSPQFLGANSKGVVITLVSSTAGLSNVSTTTDLTAAGVCTGGTCTVNGPPVPPGTDVFNVKTYNLEPTGSPLAEPAGAKVDATTGSTATPTQSDPSFTIAAGTSPTETITLFGVPAGFISTVPLNGTPGTAFTTPVNVGVTVTDAAGDAITGTEFSAPITVSDSDANPPGSPLQATQINISGGTAGLTQTLNNPTDASSLTLNYGGLAEQSFLITFTSGGGQIGSRQFSVSLATITLTPSEIDLFNPTATQLGNSGTFVASETGFSNSPYDRTFTVSPTTCLSAGVASKIYSLNATTGTTFTDTVPAGPTAGSCTVSVGGDLQLNTATETLTYTTGGFTISSKHRQ